MLHKNMFHINVELPLDIHEFGSFLSVRTRVVIAHTLLT